MAIVQQKPKTEPEIGENPASNPRAVIGGNEPPIEEQIAMEFREELLTERPDFLLRLDQVLGQGHPGDEGFVEGSIHRLPSKIEDDEWLKLAGDLAKILRACVGYVTEIHKAVKEPHLLRGRACDDQKKQFLARIEPAQMLIQSRMNEYLAAKEAERRAEEARQAAAARAAAEEAERAERAAWEAEDAARRAAEQASTQEERDAAADQAAQARHEAEERIASAQLAAAPVAKAEPVRSDAGATISGQKVWQSQVTDYEVAFMAVADDEKVREAIDKAIARRVKAGSRKIEGVKIWEAIAARAR